MTAKAASDGIEQTCHGGEGPWWCPTCQQREFLFAAWGQHCPVCVTPLLDYESLSPRSTSMRGVTIVTVPADRPRRVSDRHRAALLAIGPVERRKWLASCSVLTDKGYEWMVPEGDDDWWAR